MANNIVFGEAHEDAAVKAQAELLFKSALRGVESASIREWADSVRNRDVWLRIAEQAVKNGKKPGDADDVSRFATYMVAVAIG